MAKWWTAFGLVVSKGKPFWTGTPILRNTRVRVEVACCFRDLSTPSFQPTAAGTTNLIPGQIPAVGKVS